MNCEQCHATLALASKFCSECGTKVSKSDDGIGFLYILSNPSFGEQLLKIGQTKNNPEERAAALSSTGLPAPFKLEYSASVEGYVEAERTVHQVLASRRHTQDRKFFKCSIPDAIIAIRSS